MHNSSQKLDVVREGKNQNLAMTGGMGADASPTRVDVENISPKIQEDSGIEGKIRPMDSALVERVRNVRNGKNPEKANKMWPLVGDKKGFKKHVSSAVKSVANLSLEDLGREVEARPLAGENTDAGADQSLYLMKAFTGSQGGELEEMPIIRSHVDSEAMAFVNKLRDKVELRPTSNTEVST
ncbi:hypothetical protein E2542_SST24920 [Spatholobus suberectus]|nr:hypothetical protein E2542_SST24920 [Spatholobus suberectus]